MCVGRCVWVGGFVCGRWPGFVVWHRSSQTDLGALKSWPMHEIGSEMV